MEHIKEKFQLEGMLLEAFPYGNGHINDTYLLCIQKNDGSIYRVILQRINKKIFARPEELMENIEKVTGFLQEKIKERKGNPKRETLNIIRTKEEKTFYRDDAGDYWRAYSFVENTISYEQVENADIFYKSALSFGNFQGLLSDYPAWTLHETIKDFHNTKKRYQVFLEIVEKDPMGRAANVKDEIDFVIAHQELTEVFEHLLKKKEIPLRVTHNDTKLNNILIDEETGEGVCVIDLDTVMPGLAMNDFGDAIRFGANTANEDEKDLDKVSCDLELYEVYTRGFIEGCKGRLTKREIGLLPMGAKMMTFECGMRFLTDYLDGDCYFKIHREGHNLDRCRTQFKLVEDMEKKWDIIQEITEKYNVWESGEGNK